MKKKVWYVTGASKGLGLALVKELLEQGYKVAATSRKLSDLENSIGKTSDNFLPVQVDLKNEKNVADSIKEAIFHFGSIDVVVNNAGYGLAGAVEELSDEETRENFNVNVFGALNVIRQALPHFRKQESGHIFNVASIGGFTGAFPGFGIYCATKFAMHGFSESLREEVKPFGVQVTIVSPGYFRTEFLDASLATPANEIADYKLVRAMQDLHQHEYNGNQQGDPVKAALAMIDVANQDKPVLHLFLGKDAYALAEAKMIAIKTDMDSVREIATSTSFAAVELV